MKCRLATRLLLFLPLVLGCPVERPAFEVLGPLVGVTRPTPAPGWHFTDARWISDDGAVVAGVGGFDDASGSWRFTPIVRRGGRVEDLREHLASANRLVLSPDGSTLVASTIDRLWFWTARRLDVVDLPTGRPYVLNAPSAANGADLLAGQADFPQLGFTAALWAGEGLLPILDPSGAVVPEAAGAITPDGTVVLGHTRFDHQIFRYQPADGSLSIIDPFPGAAFQLASDVSPDGNTFVGTATTGLGIEAYRWRNGLVETLGHLNPSDPFTFGGRMSHDGRRIIGVSGASFSAQPFLWEEGIGIRPLADVVAEQGIDTRGYRIDAVKDISADGRTVVGSAESPDGDFFGYVLHLDGMAPH
jgi:uncharacterized membrane protein